ncbi:hypothetical protein FA13DRAFT_1717444 [Coprinellus micaceus]|uniref:Uncharacterized protein n=1 Tax=Coprinellus micaceus TaxID=71717 RepID=A0A4Y7SG67_COPMI|nr:hypothetical protein FA13DRAFT_1717444 [Coprinellus micaceus]
MEYHLPLDSRSQTSPQDRAGPEFNIDIITVIVRFVQALEYAKRTEAIASNPWYQETPSDTLARIRTLLELGLVCKVWEGAISDPGLWVTFLNASMTEDQFLHVVARTGDLPVEIRFRAQNAENIAGWSAEFTEVICKKIPQATTLLLDIDSAGSQSPEAERNLEELCSALFEPAPNLRTLSISSLHGRYAGITNPQGLEALFGGVPPHLQHLEMMDFCLPPQKLCLTSLVSLSVGCNHQSIVEEVLAPWLTLIRQGDIPQLTDLIVRGSPRDEWDLEPETVMEVPSSIKALRIIGSLEATTFLNAMLEVPSHVNVEIQGIHHSASPYEVRRSLFDGFKKLWCGVVPNEISLIARGGVVSLRIRTNRTIVLVFVPASQEDSLPMMTHVARSLETFHGDFEEALNSASLGNTAWLIPDGSILERDKGSLSGSVEALPSPHRLHGVFEGVSGSWNIYAVRYSVNIEGTRESHHWFDYIALFEPGEMDCEIDSIFLRYPPIKLKIPLTLLSRRNCDKRGSAMGTSQGQSWVDATSLVSLTPLISLSSQPILSHVSLRHNRTAVVGRDSDRESRNARLAWRIDISTVFLAKAEYENKINCGKEGDDKDPIRKSPRIERMRTEPLLERRLVPPAPRKRVPQQRRRNFGRSRFGVVQRGRRCINKTNLSEESKASFTNIKAPSELPFRYTFPSAQQGTATSRNSPFIPSMGRRGGIGIVETNGLGADGTRAGRGLHGSGILEEP